MLFSSCIKKSASIDENGNFGKSQMDDKYIRLLDTGIQKVCSDIKDKVVVCHYFCSTLKKTRIILPSHISKN